MDALPTPSEDARQASGALQARVREQISAAGGWLPFHAYMNTALYEPGLGYYAGGSSRFGESGDFVTAPLISPLFGGCIANVIGEWFEQVPGTITEFGAGNGQLAAQLLNALARSDQLPTRYQIVEVSASLRKQQQTTLQTLAPGAAQRVVWLDELPDRIDGVVLANEVIDAMPVHLFELRDGEVLERGLMTVRDDESLAWQSRRATQPLDRAVREALAHSTWGGNNRAELDFDAWPNGYLSELGLVGQDWLRTIGRSVGQAVVLLIDYGFPAPEFFHPQRATGTLACHYRHRVHHDPLLYPGLQDITAHVDFSALARTAGEVSLNVLGYTSQANFLLNAGLLDALSQMPADGSTADYARQSQAVQKLVSEAEMGELFKVLALATDGVSAGSAFSRGERTDALFTRAAD